LHEDEINKRFWISRYIDATFLDTWCYICIDRDILIIKKNTHKKRQGSPAFFYASNYHIFKIINMIKATVLYGHPVSPDAFEIYYAETHAKLVEK
jgi:hypothetical protein